MKHCNKCGFDKNLDEFSKDNSKPDGHGSICNTCRSEHMKNYSEANQVEISQRRRKRYLEHRDQLLLEQRYVKGNVVVVSFRANTIKNSASLQELQRILDFYSKVTNDLL